MLKCPFCHFDNEEGALFCEQCKSDLAGVAPAMATAEVATAEVFTAEVVSAQVVEATPVMTDTNAMPMANVVEAMPVMAEAPVMAVAEMPAEVAPFAPVEVAPVVEAAPVSSTESAPVAEAPPSAPPAPGTPLPAGAQVRLVVLRGLKRNVEYPVYEGLNFLGRADEKPVDIDLEDQEPPDRIWSSRQHAVITLDNNLLAIEDLNSSNGTFVNRQRIYPGQKQPLNVNDVVQIGTVQLKVII